MCVCVCIRGQDKCRETVIYLHLWHVAEFLPLEQSFFIFPIDYIFLLHIPSKIVSRESILKPNDSWINYNQTKWITRFQLVWSGDGLQQKKRIDSINQSLEGWNERIKSFGWPLNSISPNHLNLLRHLIVPGACRLDNNELQSKRTFVGSLWHAIVTVPFAVNWRVWLAYAQYETRVTRNRSGELNRKCSLHCRIVNT